MKISSVVHNQMLQGKSYTQAVKATEAPMSTLTSKELEMAIEVVSQVRKTNITLISKLMNWSTVERFKVPKQVLKAMLTDKQKLDISYENVIEDLETALIVAENNEEA